jgi:hypothetical protein
MLEIQFQFLLIWHIYGDKGSFLNLTSTQAGDAISIGNFIQEEQKSLLGKDMLLHKPGEKIKRIKLHQTLITHVITTPVR